MPLSLSTHRRIVEHMFDARDAPRDRTPPAPSRADLHAALDALLDADPSGAAGAEGSEALLAWQRLRTATDDAALALLPPWEAAEDWAREGAITATAWLTSHLGLGLTAARSFRRTGTLAASIPEVAAALRRRTIPATHAHELVRARAREVVEVFDAQVADLVEAAERLPFDAFVTHLHAWRLEALAKLARNEPDRPPGPLTEADRLSVTRSFGGRGLLSGELSPESLATLSGALDAELDAWFRSGQLSERGDASRSELHAEALLAIVRRGVRPGTTAGAPRPLLVGIADLDTLLGRTGWSEAERLVRRAEILGTGPVDDATIARLLCDAVTTVVITHQGEALWVGRTRRHATAAQRRALLATSGGRCEWPGCTAPYRHCDVHHLTAWADDGATDLPNLAQLCHHHHHALHDEGFQVTRGPTGLDVRTRHGAKVRPALPMHLPRPPTRPGGPSTDPPGPVAPDRPAG